MFLLQKTENKVRNFQQYFETELLISPKLNEKLYSSHVFPDMITKGVLFTCTYRKWLTTIFYQSLKKSKISIYQPVHFSTTHEIIFTKQYSFH